ncbi:flagellar hook-length control protein FliK [Shewanella pneumatophori]|uniref:Flagellar hook-length control protein FliK n=1 Tax=Shewanella pneumatophori TaxID=314092 RepID=A0A9X1ZIH5_9GAMM|nr:flagellar hook-length control protein FliK [Shewanella pneumatophori]MCL1140445.1 flagellar hook-length control protein FliK [Shewanella pneumatophori]
MNNSVLINTSVTAPAVNNGQIKPSNSILGIDNAEQESTNESMPFSLASAQITPVSTSFNAGVYATAITENLYQQPPITSAINSAISGSVYHSDSEPLADLNNSQTGVSVNFNAVKNDATGVIIPQIHQQKTTENISSNIEKHTKTPVTNIGFSGDKPVNQNYNPSLDLGLVKPAITPAFPHVPALQSPFTNQLLDSSNLDNIESVTNQLLVNNTRSQAAVAQWGPISVSQSAPLLQQSHDMLSPLREQIRFQIDQQIKQAEIRLDPPELGKIELNVRLEGDRLHIQMHAANSVVRDALLAGLERLRGELANDHGGQIDVDIGQGESSKERQQQDQQSNIQLASLHEPLTFSYENQQQDQVDLLA